MGKVPARHLDAVSQASRTRRGPEGSQRANRYLADVWDMPSCDRCGKIVANAGNLAQHKKRCINTAHVQARNVPALGVVHNPDASDLLDFQTDREDLQTAREVSDRRLPDICFWPLS